MFIFLFSSFRLTSISVDSDFFAYSFHDFCNTSFCPISALSEQSVFDFWGFPAFFRVSFDEVRRLRAFPPMRTATSINATDAGRHFQSAFYRVSSSLRLARSISIFPARTRVYFSSFMCERRLLVGVSSIRANRARATTDPRVGRLVKSHCFESVYTGKDVYQIWLSSLFIDDMTRETGAAHSTRPTDLMNLQLCFTHRYILWMIIIISLVIIL
jgi:hypothetical protein